MTHLPLPGDKTTDELIDEVIRVDHAGEYGAQRIYAGQLAVLKNRAVGPTIQHMADQETAHLERFTALMKQRGARPTALMPLWNMLGFAMGAGTALLGEKAAMACTVAVERVIAKHYAEQEQALPEQEAELKSTIHTFREEELEHHDIGLHHGAEQTPFYDVLSMVIAGATRSAIWLSKRI